VQGPEKCSRNYQINADGSILDAGKIVVATGSKSRPLAIHGAAHLINSDDILEMTALPDSMIFIGGGVIAMELGHVLKCAGCSVMILKAMPQLPPCINPGAINEIEWENERIGMKTLKSVDVKSIAADGNTLTASLVRDGVEKPLSAARVANGTGRVPNIDGLDLEAGGVYVTGDALSHTAQLSPVAKYEGRLVGDNIVNGDSKTP
jgi:glutathione reductase (NADPH)